MTSHVVSSASKYVHDINVVAEAKLITAAIISGLVIAFSIQYLSRYLPQRFANRSFFKPINTKIMLPVNNPSSRPSTSSVSGLRRFYDATKDITRRTSFDIPDCYIYGYPSKGGVIVLENATIPDFEFLNLSRIHPPKTRFPDSQSEDEFCQKMLLLGAKWYDSLSRFYFLKRVDRNDPDAACIDAIEEERVPAPTKRERTWVSVAWPSIGGMVVAEWNIVMWGYGKDDDRFLPYEELGRLSLCKDMDEKAVVLKEWFEGKEFQNVGEYVGNGWIRSTDLTQFMYLFAQNRVRRYLGAVPARPRAGFAPIISRGGPNLVFTRVVTEPNDPPPICDRYCLVLKHDLDRPGTDTTNTNR